MGMRDPIPFPFAFAVTCLFFILGSVSCRNHGTYEAEKLDEQEKVPGTLLVGPESSLAEDVLRDYSAEHSDKDFETVIDGNGVYYKTSLIAVIHDRATVGEVNAALKSANARITFSQNRCRAIHLQVSEPGGIDRLRKISGQLVQSGAFSVAAPESLIVPDNQSGAGRLMQPCQKY
jgi:hypothetical protein